jgi:hypothetical protein
MLWISRRMLFLSFSYSVPPEHASGNKSLFRSQFFPGLLRAELQFCSTHKIPSECRLFAEFDVGRCATASQGANSGGKFELFRSCAKRINNVLDFHHRESRDPERGGYAGKCVQL